MQQLLAPPRNGLTLAQVNSLLVGYPDPHYYRGLEVLDSSLNVVQDVSAFFQGGSVTHTAAAVVHGACSLTVTDEFTFDPRVQLLRPYMTISDGSVTGRFNCGVFRMTQSPFAYSTTPAKATLTGADRLALLDRPVGDAYVCATGVAYLDAVRQAVSDAGLGTAVNLNASAQAKTIPSPGKTFPLLVDSTATTSAPTDVTADSSTGTTWLQVINSLLDAINYRGLYCDENGVFCSEPYLTPSQRAVDYGFDFDDLLTTIITPDRVDSSQQTNPVNVWIALQNNLVDANGNPLEPSAGAGMETYVDDAGVAAQGGLKWTQILQIDAADEPSLVASLTSTVQAAQQASRQFSVPTRPFPVAGHRDIYTYSDVRAAGGQVRVEEQSWTLDLGQDTTPPATMSRAWSVVG